MVFIIDIKKISGLVLFTTVIIAGSAHYSAAQSNQQIKIDLASSGKDLKPIWAFFGYDEPNYTYMKDGRKLLSELSALSSVPVYVRVHSLLCTGNGEPSLKWGSTNAYTEDANGNPVYNWKIIDSIFDSFIQRGMKPIAEIGFMPEAMSIQPEPYKHNWKPGVAYEKIYTGWAYPPKDYNKWHELVYQWVKHCVARYGEREVNTWWWEVWNEPNISYWKGTRDEYFKLYDYAADAVKKACPHTRIGGPTTTGPGWDQANDFLKSFLQHCDTGKNYITGGIGSPLEYISFHAKGSPTIVSGHVRMNMATQFNDIYKGFQTVASFKKYKKLPIIIGECDPEGCAACSMELSPQNAYRNGTMYASYTAASFARIFDLADNAAVNLEGAVSWSFEFENQRWFDGFRDLATNGIDKPVLNVFRMFGMMHGRRLAVINDNAIPLDTLRINGVHGVQSDISALASAGEHTAGILLWNYHDDDLPFPAAGVSVQLSSIPAKKVLVHQYRVDKEHSNAYECWKKMGSPQNVSDAQYMQLEAAGQLQLIDSPHWLNVNEGRLELKISLPGQAVSFFRLNW